MKEILFISNLLSEAKIYLKELKNITETKSSQSIQFKFSHKFYYQTL